NIPIIDVGEEIPIKEGKEIPIREEKEIPIREEKVKRIPLREQPGASPQGNKNTSNFEPLVTALKSRRFEDRIKGLDDIAKEGARARVISEDIVSAMVDRVEKVRLAAAD